MENSTVEKESDIKEGEFLNCRVHSFCDREISDGVTVYFIINGTGNVQRFLEIHKEFKVTPTLQLAISVNPVGNDAMLDSKGVIVVPCQYKSYDSQRKGLKIKVDFPPSKQADVEQMVAACGDQNITLKFFFDAKDVPKSTFVSRKAPLGSIHASLKALAMYDGVDPSIYKEEYKRKMNIESFGEVNPVQLDQIKRALLELVNSLVGPDKYLMLYPSCEICGKTETAEVHHIKSRGHIVDETEYDRFINLITLCRDHHNEFHNYGPERFGKTYNNWKVNKSLNGNYLS